ncbi:gamma-butyrobetaine hydroxylase-like domain-containing protein, partial [Dokdonella sp.]|uniref:gamma-butyrobetaine hydroxylase-like domain-containing protein n=1 Tax=Dokdonella sp. TaxID=2291710 RepID=UPI003C4E1A57
LEVGFDDGVVFRLPAEYLRVNSPSAEVQGHGPGQKVLVAGKIDVNIDEIAPVGNYAVLLKFSDGHQTGIFAWDTLYTLGQDHAKNWAEYLAALDAAGKGRAG